MERIFKPLLIIEDATKNVSQFINLLKSISDKNFVLMYFMHTTNQYKFSIISIILFIFTSISSRLYQTRISCSISALF